MDRKKTRSTEDKGLTRFITDTISGLPQIEENFSLSMILLFSDKILYSTHKERSSESSEHPHGLSPCNRAFWFIKWLLCNADTKYFKKSIQFFPAPRYSYDHSENAEKNKQSLLKDMQEMVKNDKNCEKLEIILDPEKCPAYTALQLLDKKEDLIGLLRCAEENGAKQNYRLLYKYIHGKYPSKSHLKEITSSQTKYQEVYKLEKEDKSFIDKQRQNIYIKLIEAITSRDLNTTKLLEQELRNKIKIKKALLHTNRVSHDEVKQDIEFST